MATLSREEVLCVPKRRRLVSNTVKGAEGQDELHVFYGDKEIVFDEPELLPFGTKLVQVERFRAEDAMGWSDGNAYDWEQVRELLQALLDQEVLKRATEASEVARPRAYPQTLGSAPANPEPRTFSAHDGRCPMLTKEAVGRTFELGNLEAVIPVYRVAHPALDQDGRQVGENNVTPRALFLDLPTERRLCNYAGARYQVDVPMNVTALRHMTKRWPELLALTEEFRTAFLARLPPREAGLCTGDAHLLAVGCLASVGYVMVRGEDPVPNGELDGGLAAMFRLIDGVRIVTTERVRHDATAHGCDRPVDAAAIVEYAERYSLYTGTHGVCAGPQALIEEYMRVLLDGVEAPIRAEPSLAARLGDLEAALDYGLRGQRVESVLRVFGGLQGLLHERLRRAFAVHAPGTELHAILERPIDTEHYPLLRETHPLLETLQLEVEVNRWLYARAGAGLPDASATAGVLLDLPSEARAEEQRRIAEFFARVLPDHASLPEAARLELAAVAAELFALERLCLCVAEEEQGRLNVRLRRAPGSPLTGQDLAAYNRPRTGPPLEETFTKGLGLSIVTKATSTELTFGGETLSLSDA
ncbi:MAG TPA: hypothetical protein VGI39_24290 [Polyangiaceae bacterium]|jgi:hypothetical protein